MTDQNMKNLLETLNSIEQGSREGKKLFEDFGETPFAPAAAEEEHSNMEMVRQIVMQIKEEADEVLSLCQSCPEVESWVVSKLSRSSENIENVKNYLKYEGAAEAASEPAPVSEPMVEPVAPEGEMDMEVAADEELEPLGKETDYSF